jgi:hypothetical protein
MRAAVVDLQTNIVVNTIVVDSMEDLPPDGCFLVNVDDIWCDMDALYDPATGVFTDLNPPAPEEPAPEEPVV